MSRLVRWVALFGVLATSCGSGLGFAIALDIRFAPSVSSAALTSVTALQFQASGGEAYLTTVELGRHAKQVESIVYEPSPGTRSIVLTVTALDSTHNAVASGMVGPLVLTPGQTTHADVELEPTSGTNDASVDDFMPHDADQTDLGATLLFDDEFSSGLGQWTSYGTGTWSVTGGEALQTDSTSDLTFIYAPVTLSFTDFHIITHMRLYQVTSGDTAIETAFRTVVSPQLGQYFCDFNPQTGDFNIMVSFGSQTEPLADVVSDITLPGYQPTQWFTMHVDAMGSSIHCWIDEVPTADLAITNTQFTTGAVGLKTYDAEGAFDYIRVYDHQP